MITMNNMILPIRYIAVSRPFLTLQQEKHRLVARLMVGLAWLVSLLLSSLQALVFSLQKHPQACEGWTGERNVLLCFRPSSISARQGILLRVTPQWFRTTVVSLSCEI